MSDLSYREYRDFTGGLWERGNDREVPSNGLLDLNDYYPLPTGGLRAGFRWNTYIDSSQPATAFGLPSSAVTPMGFAVFHDDHSTAPNRMLMMVAPDSLPGTIELFGSTSTASTGAPSFTTIRSHTSAQNYVPTRFVQYASTALGPIERVYYHVGDAQPTSELGVWQLTAGASAISTHVGAAVSAYHLTAHQARLVGVSQFGGNFKRQRIDFSDPNSTANYGASTNQFVLDQGHGGDVGYLEAYMPGDLLAHKKEWGWYTIQGGFPFPFVRQATNVHPSQEVSWAARTPAGLAYLTATEGVWAFNGGNYPTHLSPQFVGSPMTEETLVNTGAGNREPSFLGVCEFASRWLFTPKGYVWDADLGAWWKSTPLNTTPVWPWIACNQVTGHVYATRATSSGAIQTLVTSTDESSMDRSLSGDWTLPLIYEQGMNVVLRELELHLETFSATSTVDVTLTRPDPSGGADLTTTIPTKTLTGATRHHVRILLGLSSGSANAPWWKVNVATSAATVEAPMLERMFVGTQPGTRYRET